MHATFRRSTPTLLAPFVLLAGCSQAAQGQGEGAATATIHEALTDDNVREPFGAVFTQTNASERNELVAFARGADGSLTPDGRFDTGGTGTGSGLSAQGALAREGRWLFVVNAGSNDVSTFDLATHPPALVSRVPSGGTQPVSVAVHEGLVYVLDAGGTGDIAGFRADPQGQLHPIDMLPLSGPNVVPTEVAFAPDGDTLVVTEKGTNQIDTYYVDANGIAHGPKVSPSNGPAPFGFDFTPAGELVVSEAANSAASAYALRGEVRLESISASVLDGQSAACWLVTSSDGRHAFAANAGSGTLSSYQIGGDGQLTLESGVAATIGAGSHPIDMAFGGDGEFLFALANQAGTITAFRVEGGNLTRLGSVDSLPASATGVVAR
jgi:6-phosphogluconolactonase